MARARLIPKSRLTAHDGLDTVAARQGTGCRKAFDVLMEAQNCWDNLERFRRDRSRAKRYVYGDQWGDVVRTSDGCTTTEEQYIKGQGKVPLKNNLMRRLVRNVLGVYRSQSKEPTCTARDRDEQKLGETMSTILQCNWQMNRMTELNARSMEEFLISGLIVHHKWFGWRNDKLDCWTDYVQPNNFFIDNNMRDFRGWDCSVIGEVHDVDFNALCRQFAKSPDDYARLRDIYRGASMRSYIAQNAYDFGYSRRNDNWDFLFCSDPTRCRVVEVWRKESKPRFRCHDYLNGDVYKVDEEDFAELVEAENAQRMEEGVAQGMPADDIPLIEAEWFMDDYWYYYFLSPLGDVLDEGETPYEHKSHPYAFKMYPFLDGEIHSFAADVIDQQRYVNRLITLQDWIMGSSAKGVLMFPEECVSDYMSLEEIADEWHRFNGVIICKTKDGARVPQQIATNSTNIGIGELLNLQLKFFEDISGVNGALQGKPGFSGISASLYSQQTQNATTSLLDLLDCYSQFTTDAAYKDVKNMQQFYDGKRVFNIAGKSGAQIEYDPKKIRDVEFDLSIVESQSTPAYRQLANDFLMQLWQQQAISVEQLLEFGEFPFADGLLQSIKSQQEQVQQGQQPQGVPPELAAQAQQGANMNAVGQAYGALRG